MNKKVGYILILTLLLNACIPNKKIITMPPETVSGLTISNFNGNYLNSYVSIIGDKSTNARKETLTQILEEVRNTKLKLSPYPDSTLVNLKYTSNRLYVKIFENEELVEEFELEAQIEGNYLSIKRKYQLIPIPFFLLLYDHKLFFAINEKGNIIAKYGYSHGGWFLIMPNGHYGLSTLEYQKIN